MSGSFPFFPVLPKMKDHEGKDGILWVFFPDRLWPDIRKTTVSDMRQEIPDRPNAGAVKQSRANTFATLTLLSALLSALLVSSCAPPAPRVRVFSSPPPSSGEYSDTGATASRPRPEDGGAVTITGTHTVKRGETLYAISRSYDVPIRTLIVSNDLRPPYTLRVGQQIRIPAARYHVVSKGDTVYSISRKYDVAMNELVRVNRIAPPYTIRVGQRLAIPGKVEGQGVTTASASGEKGDAAQATARKTVTPPAGKPAPQEKAPAGPDYASNVGPGDTVIKSGVPHPRAKPEPPRRLASAIPQPPARSSSKFAWPVRGRIVSSFGPKERGLHNDGLNIAAPRGTPIRAAENGVVAYSGSELKGFGNMVIVKHTDGYMTAYAHADSLLVSRGETVRRGQVIAKVGSTGNVDSPQLHFEIRKGKSALNPIGKLGG